MSFLDLNLPVENDFSSTSSSSPLSNSEQRVFPCGYCRRKFYSSQALGGHQNAHRIERDLVKKSRRNIAYAVKSHSQFNQPAPRSGSGGSSRGGRQVQPLVLMDQIGHQEHVGTTDFGREVDDQEDFSQLDLSLRL